MFHLGHSLPPPLKEAKTKKAAQEKAAKKEEEEKKATEQKEAKKRKADFLLTEEEWLYARAKEFVKDLWDAEYIDEDISEPACTSLLNQYLERRQADKDTLEYLPQPKDNQHNYW